MPHASYPSETDLVNRLEGAGIEQDKIDLLQAIGTLSDAVKAAIDEWQTATDWQPYLAVTGTRTFDAPFTMSGGVAVPTTRLALGSPLLTISSIGVNGAAMPRTGYAPGPQNAAAEGKPYQWLLFHSLVGTSAGSIVITGSWGRVTAIPDNVWDAILQQAQTLIAGDLALAITEGMTERKIGDSTKKFAGAGSEGPLDLQTKLWQSRWERLVNSEKRVTF